MTPNEVALWEKYRVARSWFDKAVDQRNEALQDAREWKEIANWRYRRSTSYVLCFFGFTIGLLAGSILSLLR